MKLEGIIADWELESRKLVLFCGQLRAGQAKEKVIIFNVEPGTRVISESHGWLTIEDLKVGQHVIVRYLPEEDGKVIKEVIVSSWPVSVRR